MRHCELGTILGLEDGTERYVHLAGDSEEKDFFRREIIYIMTQKRWVHRYDVFDYWVFFDGAGAGASLRTVSTGSVPDYLVLLV